MTLATSEQHRVPQSGENSKSIVGITFFAPPNYSKFTNCIKLYYYCIKFYEIQFNFSEIECHSHRLQKFSSFDSLMSTLFHEIVKHFHQNKYENHLNQIKWEKRRIWNTGRNLRSLQQNLQNIHEICRVSEFGVVQHSANFVNFENSYCWKIRLLSLSQASIQLRTSPPKFPKTSQLRIGVAGVSEYRTSFAHLRWRRVVCTVERGAPGTNSRPTCI